MILDLILTIIYNFLNVYMFIIFVYVILSWTPLINSQFSRILGTVVDPYLNIFRGKLIVGMFDLGGTLGILLLYLVTILMRSFIM